MVRGLTLGSFTLQLSLKAPPSSSKEQEESKSGAAGVGGYFTDWSFPLETRVHVLFATESDQEVSIKTNASSSPASPDMDTPSTFFLNLSLNKLVLYLLLGASNKHKNKKNN